MKIRKCLDYLLLVIVLLIAVDCYYPAAMSMLGMCAEEPCGHKIVSDQVGTNGVPLVIHNIGEGTKEESYLLANIVEGNFRCSSVGQ